MRWRIGTAGDLARAVNGTVLLLMLASGLNLARLLDDPKSMNTGLLRSAVALRLYWVFWTLLALGCLFVRRRFAWRFLVWFHCTALAWQVGLLFVVARHLGWLAALHSRLADASVGIVIGLLCLGTLLPSGARLQLSGQAGPSR